MSKIKSIITDYFDFDFFWKEHSKKNQLIQNLAQQFTAQYPDVLSSIFQDIRELFPDVKVNKYTYFIDEDRCINFEITLQNSDKIVVAISIFGYFIAWQELTDNTGFDKYIFESQNKFLDEVFHKIVNPKFKKQLEWISKNDLSIEIEEFNHDKTLQIGNSPIYFANLLTRFH